MCSNECIDWFFSKFNTQDSVFCYVETDAVGLSKYKDRAHKYCKYTHVSKDYVLRNIVRFSKKLVQESLEPMPALYVLTDIHIYKNTFAN